MRPLRKRPGLHAINVSELVHKVEEQTILGIRVMQTQVIFNQLNQNSAMFIKEQVTRHDIKMYFTISKLHLPILQVILKLLFSTT